MFAATNIGAPALLLGFVMSVVGVTLFVWFVVAVVRSGPKCPACFGRIDKRATVCPHCQADLATKAL